LAICCSSAAGQFENDRLTDPAVAAGDDRHFVL
jgi:hypothetical protein